MNSPYTEINTVHEHQKQKRYTNRRYEALKNNNTEQDKLHSPHPSKSHLLFEDMESNKLKSHWHLKNFLSVSIITSLVSVHYFQTSLRNVAGSQTLDKKSLT
jgi:hypothetical protein